MEIKKMPKNAQEFYCEKCDFSCNKKSNFEKHLLTTKHKMEINGNIGNGKNADFFECENCSKTFKSNSGLWKHKKKCLTINNEIKTENIKTESKHSVDYKDMFLEMMKQNQELQSTLQSVIPKMGNTTTNNTNITNHYNLHVFLNEQCKDALNIMDFINSLHLQFNDLESTGRLGFVEGTSKIIINGLKELDVHKRPIHCSDLQNEILYVKDDNIWKRDNDNKDTMKKAIDEVSRANIKQLPQWITENSDNSNEEEYMKIVSNIMKMDDMENDKTEIIKKVSKEVMLNDEKRSNN
tara:strand:+ start:4431 stop:5315 length:885 start_codon:yes stop_codon:yes gene_type:complete